MPSASSSALTEQLNRSSVPYRDPLARIRWDRLNLHDYWLPPEAVSLHGVGEFMALPDDVRRRLSQYEFLYFLEAGLWLEGIFMERLARTLRRMDEDIVIRQYRLHELREEAGHSLMFLEMRARSGLAFPSGLLRPPRFASFLGRHAPLDSLLFWLAVLVGEEVPDRLNRYIRTRGDALCPTAYDLCTLHIRDEARHLAYAREMADERLAVLSAWPRTLLASLFRPLFRQFVLTFYYPQPVLYESAGLFPGKRWEKLARASEARRNFVRQRLTPTLARLQRQGLALSLD